MICLLIFLIIFALIDWCCNISNKLFNFPTNQKGIKIFLHIIYIFPIAASTLALHYIDKLEMKDVFTSVLSYYATALSITLTTYTFYKKQKEKMDELEKEKHKESEERKKAEKENLKLRERELEAQRDYYRPIFVIEDNKHNNTKQVRLLMKDDTLYLENIIIHSKSHKTFGQEKQCKSGEIIESNITSGSFYITAQTLVGETILFGYLNGGVKVYKYLNHNKDPKYPTKDTIINEDNKDKINETWGSYNKTSDEYDITLEQFFFNATSHIRNEYLFNYKNAEFKRILYTNTYEEFFEKAFWALDDFLTFCAPDKIKVARHVFQLMDILTKKESDLDLVVKSDISVRLEDYCKDDSQLDTVKQKIEECKPNNSNSNFDISSFLNFLLIWNLKIIHKEEDEDRIILLVKILMITFSSIKVTSKSNEQLNKVKDIILTL